MKVLLFGASGMIGQGVLRECLLDPAVSQVLSVARTSCGIEQPKFRELIHPDLWNYQSIAGELSGFDACFFCLGVSSAGMTEADYAHITYDLTIAAAQTVVTLNPGMVFIYVSGMGTDSSEQGRSMWARIKGKTENRLLNLPFKGSYMFRPGVVQPLHGITSKTRWYRIFYATFRPIMPVLRWCFPGVITTTEQVGQAMISIARTGFPKRILENRDICTIPCSSHASE